MAVRTSYRFPFELYPAVRIVLLLIAGILLAGIFTMDLYLSFLVFGVLLAAVYGFDHYIRQNLIAPAFPVMVVIYLVFLVFFGWFRANIWVQSQTIERPEVEILSLYDNEDIVWYGRVRESTLNATGTAAIWLDVDSVRVNKELPVWKHSFYTQIRFFRADEGIVQQAKPGAYISVRASPSAVPERRNPHDFDVQRWLHSQDVYIQGVGSALLEVHREPVWYQWGWWRYGLRNGIETVFSEQQAPLAKAVMIGYKSELDREVRQSFSRAGLAHIMAVSGMHVGFVLFPLWLIIPLFWNYRYGKIAGLIIITGVLFFYAGVTGFAPSVQRASVFAFFVAFARLYKRRRDPINLTGVAAIIILLVDPGSIYQIGFQMSFVAVLTIFVSLPVIMRLFRPEIRYRWYARITQLVLLSLCIQLALFPILVDLFREFSVVGPVLNTIAAPLTQVMFIWGFLCTALGYFIPEIATMLNLPADYLVWFLEWMTVTAASYGWSYLSMPLPSVFIYGLWFCLFAFLASIFISALRWKWLILTLVFLTLWQIESFIDTIRPNSVKVTFFDVGQGDALLIQTPSGKNILYDTGVLTPFGNSGDRVILPHLQAEGISRLDAIILSHPHADHIGGILSLIEHIEIDAIYDPGLEHNTVIFAGYRRAAERENIPIIEVEMGDTIDIDPAMPIFVLGPHPEISLRNPNEHSVVVRIQYGNDSLLLTGDAETQAERLTTEQFGNFLDTDILKAGHHGSRTSSHGFFLEEVRPQKVVVSNALRNRYNHPHPEATYRLLNTGAAVKYTSLQGAVILEMTGNGIRYVDWR